MVFYARYCLPTTAANHFAASTSIRFHADIVDFTIDNYRIRRQLFTDFWLYKTVREPGNASRRELEL